MANTKKSTAVPIKNSNGNTPLHARWTVPPFCHDVVGAPPKPPGGRPPLTREHVDQSFQLTQGVVYKIEPELKVMMQNVSENEDDYIEFSDHGDPCGIWNKVDVSNFLEIDSPIYLYNRTHKQNAVMAIISEH